MPPTSSFRSRTAPVPAPRRPAGGFFRAAVALLLAIPLAACATKRDVRDLGDEIRAQNQAQAELIAELRAEQAELESIVRALTGVQEERHGEVLRRLRQLQDEVQLTQEIAGASQAGLAAVRDQLSRGTPAPGAGAGGRAPFFEETPGAAGEVEDLYAEALTQHGRSSLAAARIGFQEIVDRFPNHELAPDARYYLADILSRDGEMDEALRGFLQVGELYPQAARVPEALYRAAIIYRDRGEAEQARALFTRIVNTWPDSEVAEMARAFLGGTSL